MVTLKMNVAVSMEAAIEISDEEYKKFLQLRASPFPEDKIAFKKWFEHYESKIEEKVLNHLQNCSTSDCSVDEIKSPLYDDVEMRTEDSAGKKKYFYWDD